MKLKIAVVLIFVALAWVIGRSIAGGGRVSVPLVSNSGSGQEEIHRSYKLEPGAQVEVRSINGTVEIETAETDAAEVHVVQTAKHQSDLAGHEIIIEQNPRSLTVYGKKTEGHWWNFWGGGQVRQRVTLRIPRRVELTAKGVNGSVKVGEVDGALSLKGVNGGVELAQSAGLTEVSGVNGGVSVNVGRLGEQGLVVKGVNGGVELYLAGGLNADLHIKGLNGSVSNEVPNLT
ncbi:MAG: DUF4097 family beta strand repeat-containing protein, partial [Pyrinomonadaceae bacterium]